MISKVRGTQDFLDVALFKFIENNARSFLHCNNFQEIATPIIESMQLYARSLGQETDVITKQMFLLQSREHDAQEVLCLRPEATASTMRAYLEHRHQLPSPWKIFSCGPMFRYERPQKGRYRQFHQFNIEILNTDSIYQDAYFISMLDRFFTHKLLLDNYALLINFLGCPQDRAQYKEILRQYVDSIAEHICQNCMARKEKNILRVLDCKEAQCQEYYKKAPQITDHLCTTCKDEWNILQKSLSMLSISFTHAPALVRGLDYYDKTVFEFVSQNLGAQSAFCSGGRYNHLAEQLESKESVPSIGAAMGMERLLLLLEPIIAKLPLPSKPAFTLILPVEQAQKNLALLIADQLHMHGKCVDILLDGGSLKSMMKKANAAGTQHVIIIGPEEQQAGMVVLKNMVTGQEQKVKQIDINKLI